MGVSKYALFLSMLAMLLPISAAARSDNQRKVNLSTAVEVGSTQLQPGTYRLEWQGNGPAVNVEFIQNGQTVATTQARWVDKSQPAPYDSVVTEKAGNNQNRLMEIDFHKQKQVLQFSNVNSRSGM
jgi:uncharacterized protein YhdP